MNAVNGATVGTLSISTSGPRAALGAVGKMERSKFGRNSSVVSTIEM